MKRITALFLALVYLSTSMGATIHRHFCMGKLTSWSLIDLKNSHCPNCGMMNKQPGNAGLVSSKDCCHDEATQLKSSIDQKFLPAAPPVFRAVLMAPPTQTVAGCPPLSSRIVKNAYAHGPPAPSGQNIFLLNRNLRL